MQFTAKTVSGRSYILNHWQISMFTLTSNSRLSGTLIRDLIHVSFSFHNSIEFSCVVYSLEFILFGFQISTVICSHVRLVRFLVGIIVRNYT